jgi:hypothetical protein
MMWWSCRTGSPAGTVMILVSGGNMESQIGLSNIQNVSGDSVTLSGLAVGASN